METVSGVNNWKLTVRREAGGVTILRAATCDRRAVLPETLFGLPVTALGDRALAPGRTEEGEEVVTACGPAPAGADWDNGVLEDLTLPDSLERVGDYALFNCRTLRTLRLRDTVLRWGGGALMNCRALADFRVTCTGREGELLAYLAGELSRELDVSLRYGEETVRLIFPEYVEVYEENCPAHHFDYNIYGAGYSYHHCFYQKKLDLKAYDGLWQSMLGMEHDPRCAVRLAYWRLRTPRDLTGTPAAAYRAYLRGHLAEAAAWLLEERDAAGLRFLLDQAPPDRETLSAACAMAREQGAAEALALLLEERRRRFPGGLQKTFDL